MYMGEMQMVFTAQDDMHWLLTILIRPLDKIVCKQSVISIVFLKAEEAKIFDISQFQKVSAVTLMSEGSGRTAEIMI